MKQHLIVLGSILISCFLIGCGDPSVEDVCGGCTGIVRDACEDAYELCKDQSGCSLEDLEESYDVACASGSFLIEDDAGL